MKIYTDDFLEEHLEEYDVVLSIYNKIETGYSNQAICLLLDYMEKKQNADRAAKV